MLELLVIAVSSCSWWCCGH